mmetsp:Transcript_28119/g.72762  ORF Transcript_28119/g.72762 Transcript_28119/m.72762 type:complete len:103 (+) Transcript_28119:1537-1845(+)
MFGGYHDERSLRKPRELTMDEKIEKYAVALDGYSSGSDSEDDGNLVEIEPAKWWKCQFRRRIVDFSGPPAIRKPRGMDTTEAKKLLRESEQTVKNPGLRKRK